MTHLLKTYPSHDDAMITTSPYNDSSILNHTSHPLLVTSQDELPDQVVSVIWIYFSPLILIVGFFGNTLNIVILRRHRFRSSTVSLYLPYIAVCDNFFLVMGIIPEWLTYMDIVVFGDIHPWTCKLEKFLFYTSGDIAIWILTAFTFDRFCAVCYPLRKSLMCSHKHSVIACVILSVLVVLKNVGVFWTRGTQYQDIGSETVIDLCGYTSSKAEYFAKYIRPWLAFTLISCVPFVLIITFNVMIVRVLFRRQHFLATSGGGDSQSQRPQTTIMCITVSMLFLVTITPSMVLLIGKPYWNTDLPEYKISKAIVNLSVYLNHSLNFFMYCMSGSHFRVELKAVFRCRPETDASLSRAVTPKNIESLKMQALGSPSTNRQRLEHQSYGTYTVTQNSNHCAGSQTEILPQNGITENGECVSENASTSPSSTGYVNEAAALEDEITRV